MPSSWYDENASTVVPQYEAIDPTALHAWLRSLLPNVPSAILDIGAGSGRDAAWLASLGHEVVAAEPAAAMRREAQRLHPSPRIRWIDDALPDLEGPVRSAMSFNIVLASAVWQHVHPSQRGRAFRKMASLLKPSGVLALTLRHGPDPERRGMHPVSLEEVEALARDHGLAVIHSERAADVQGRPQVSWTRVALRLPDDGTGALPLLRHIILNDQKAATYKLGLLRALCRAADAAAGLARDHSDEFIALPLGLVALNWLRLYLPLVAARLPQAPGNSGPDGLGFAGPGFRALHSDGLVAAPDLRVGARLSGAAAGAVHAALREAARTITVMPATFMTYPNGGVVLPVDRGRPGNAPDAVMLDTAYLRRFGEMRVPTHLWRALQRFSVWVEPALVAKWARLMTDYGRRQGREINPGTIAAAMVWSDPERDVLVPRRIALCLAGGDHPLHCAWTGRVLTADTLDIDHMFPWSAWPCGDLWNLLPAHRMVNQRLKRDRLPSAQTLALAGERILAWWQTAYLTSVDPLLPGRFGHEAQASLPGVLSERGENCDPERVLTAVGLQRMRLHHDQQVPEWAI